MLRGKDPQILSGGKKMRNGRVLRTGLCRDCYGWVVIECLRGSIQSPAFYCVKVRGVSFLTNRHAVPCMAVYTYNGLSYDIS